ncbi:hypothetical protein Hypma_006744 [Hypsizygus marmoreus]|uniref:Uncharacterized protein n=1 Tax=Hypsizygus marmoreus TaxID=39966 RepID=A0A369JX57_HYPMA|nr:hypothetical protein Hypma_006744 [Hypsizygus marmoreus]
MNTKTLTECQIGGVWRTEREVEVGKGQIEIQDDIPISRFLVYLMNTERIAFDIVMYDLPQQMSIIYLGRTYHKCARPGRQGIHLYWYWHQQPILDPHREITTVAAKIAPPGAMDTTIPTRIVAIITRTLTAQPTIITGLAVHATLPLVEARPALPRAANKGYRKFYESIAITRTQYNKIC